MRLLLDTHALMIEQIPLVSNDSVLDAYPIRRLW